jgi:hypothetical protein
MRMLLPGVKLRRRIRELLSTFYNDCQYPDFNEALRLLAEFYKVPVPAVEWHEYRQREDARPDLGVLHFVEEEKKADRYAGQFVTGL